MAYDPIRQVPLVPTQFYVALMLSPGDQTGPGAEVARPEYARKLVTFMQPSDAPNPPPVLANVATTEWPRAISLWGDIGWLTIYQTDGSYFGWGEVVNRFDEMTPEIVRIDRGDVCRFSASGILLTPGYQVPRPYSSGPYGAGPYSRGATMLAIASAVSGAFLPGNAPCCGVSNWALEALP